MASHANSLWAVNQVPSWAGDYFSREHVLPGGIQLDAAQFTALDGVTVTLSANAAQGATTITVAALTGPIPVNTILYFGAGKFARLTVAAALGHTSLTVQALPTALSNGDVATYAGVGQKIVVSGTPVGRTFTERAAGTAFGPAASTDDEIFLLVWDVDLDRTTDADAYRKGGLVKENLLPGFASMAAGLVTKLRTIYETTRGV